MYGQKIAPAFSALLSFPRRRESSEKRSAFSGTLIDWMPEEIRHDVVSFELFILIIGKKV
jgi:hypothetical protein